MIDHAFEDHDEMRDREGTDDASEHAHRILHGPDSPYTLPSGEQTEPGLVTTRASRPCGSLADGAGARANRKKAS